MRAVVIEAPGNIRVDHVPDPTPRPDEVLVQVGACGICGTDLHIVDGDSPLARYPIIRVLDNPGRIQPIALNVGIRAATGEILMRMDAHALYPKNYISDLVAALQTSGADNVGGVLITAPARETLW